MSKELLTVVINGTNRYTFMNKKPTAGQKVYNFDYVLIQYRGCIEQHVPAWR